MSIKTLGIMSILAITLGFASNCVKSHGSGTNEPYVPQTITTNSQPEAPTDMVLVPAGEFWMGCNEAVDPYCTNPEDQEPYHNVYLDAYYIDKYEVTVKQYTTCVNAGKCTSAHFDDGTCEVWDPTHWVSGWNILPESFRGADQPVVCVDWHQAKTFCEYAGKRLPTEAEWEKAARGTDGRKYPWGNEDATCNYAVIRELTEKTNGCGRNSTWPVGSKPLGASPYGVMDMSGNAQEMVLDWYDENYYSSSPNRNPKGPESGKSPVIRGGSWLSIESGITSTDRNYTTYPVNVPEEEAFDYWNDYTGFRCAKSPKTFGVDEIGLSPANSRAALFNSR